MPHETRFADPDTMATTLAWEIGRFLREAVAERGAASLVAAGGRTPLDLYRRLAGEDVPWQHVWVTLSDERWVPETSEDSNERLIREALLTGPAAVARIVPLKTPDAEPEDAVADRIQALQRMPRPFDVVVLGMGEDGHTASLFPDTPGLETALDGGGGALVAAMRLPDGTHPRLSLTAAALLDSRRIFVVITGPAKWRTYERAREPGPTRDMPVRAVLHQDRVDVDVTWAP